MSQTPGKLMFQHSCSNVGSKQRQVMALEIWVRALGAWVRGQGSSVGWVGGHELR